MLSYEQTISIIASELFDNRMCGSNDNSCVWSKIQLVAVIFEKDADVVNSDAKAAYENKKKAYYARN